MSAQTFLSLLAASTGFVSALFFVLGPIDFKIKDIVSIASSAYGGFSRAFANSLAAQRADYIVGALLLVLTFSLQIAANLIPISLQAGTFLSFDNGIYAIVFLTCALLLIALAFRAVLAKSTRKKIQLELEARNIVLPRPKDGLR